MPTKKSPGRIEVMDPGSAAGRRSSYFTSTCQELNRAWKSGWGLAPDNQPIRLLTFPFPTPASGNFGVYESGDFQTHAFGKFQKLKRTPSWNIRLPEDPMNVWAVWFECPNNGELRLPTGVARLTVFKRLRAKMLNSRLYRLLAVLPNN